MTHLNLHPNPQQVYVTTCDYCSKFTLPPSSNGGPIYKCYNPIIYVTLKFVVKLNVDLGVYNWAQN